MNYQLIMLPNPILVSDEEIKEGWFYHPNGSIFPVTPAYLKGPISSGIMKKVIAGIPELPQLDLSLVADEIGYMDVGKLAKAEHQFNHKTVNEIAFRLGFEEGFNANPKKYTEEDIRKAIKYGIDSSIGYTHSTDYMTKEELGKITQIEEKFISSLSEPKVYNVEVEMMYKNGRGHGLIQTNIPNISNNTIKVTKIL